MLVPHLWQPPEIRDILELQEYVHDWWKVQETMVLAPSNIHFGHYMVGTYSKVVVLVNAILTNYPLATGLAPTQWLNTLNVMLEKLPGNNLIKSSCSLKEVSIIITSGWEEQLCNMQKSKLLCSRTIWKPQTKGSWDSMLKQKVILQLDLDHKTTSSTMLQRCKKLVATTLFW